MENDINIFDDIVFDGNDLFLNAQQAAWNKLIDEIVKGNVIPLIGPDIMIDKYNIHSRIVNSLAKKFNIQSEPTSFSELVYDHDFLKQVKDNKDSIYEFMNKIFSKPRLFKPSTILKDLLSIKQFPFVIVTSFTPIAEEVMSEVWGKELKVLRFNNNPTENDDIVSEADLRKPTIYYMFGKVGDMAHRYVLTDTDMLDFCTSWLTEGKKRPQKLARTIKDKYLLMLGNNYSDWLFRFIWYSIRKNGKGDELVASDHIEDELSQFLERNHTFMCNNPGEVIEQIKVRLAQKLKDNEDKKFDSVETDVDVFISYSRTDLEIASELYTQLSNAGKRVWFDKKDISAGGDFGEEILEGIRTARYFVPILSKNIEEEINTPHYYRHEWEEAGKKAISLGRTFVIPITEKGFSYSKAAIPDRIQRYNGIEYDGVDSIKEVADSILHVINNQ